MDLYSILFYFYIVLGAAIYIYSIASREPFGQSFLGYSLIISFAGITFLLAYLYATSNIYLLVLYLFLAYFGVCSFFKKRSGRKMYIVAFILSSVILVFALTSVFGSYYFYTDEITRSSIYQEVKHAMDSFHPHITEDLMLNWIFFSAGIGYYFIKPDNFSLSNVHFFQWCVGLVLAGTIVTWLFEYLRSLMPSVKSKKQ